MNEPLQTGEMPSDGGYTGPVFVLGMHRSGTSLVAGILHKGGAVTGENNELIPLDSSNERGYFENRAIVDINDEILSLFGGSWDTPPDLFDGFSEDGRLVYVKKKIESFILGMNKRYPLWAIKDPRMCFTFTVWEKYLPKDMPIIVTYRNPEETLISLKKREQKEEEAFFPLWMSSWKEILKIISRKQVFHVSYKWLLNDPEQVCRDLDAYVHSEHFSYEKNKAEISKFISQDLRHNHTERVSVPDQIIGTGERRSPILGIFDDAILFSRKIINKLSLKEEEKREVQEELVRVKEDGTVQLNQQSKAFQEELVRVKTQYAEQIQSERTRFLEQQEVQQRTFYEQYQKLQSEWVTAVRDLHQQELVFMEQEENYQQILNDERQEIYLREQQIQVYSQELRERNEELKTLHFNIQELHKTIEQKNAALTLMEASAFWQLRFWYLRIKWAMGNPVKLISKYSLRYLPHRSRIVWAINHPFKFLNKYFFKIRGFLLWKTIYYISEVENGGSKKYIDDLKEQFKSLFVDFVQIKNKKDLDFYKEKFKKRDMLLFQYLFYTDLTIGDIIAVKQDYEITLVIPIHDFYFLGQTSDDLYVFTPQVHSNYVSKKVMRPEIVNLFEIADHIIYPSRFVKEVFDAVCIFENATVVNHIDYPLIDHVKIPTVDHIINVGIINTITPHKGETYYPNLFKIDQYKGYKVRYHIFGHNKISSPNVVFHGPYSETEIFSLLQKNNVHGIVFLNEHAETYSYALTKAINSGLPIVYSDFGAYRERLMNNKKSFAVPDITMLESAMVQMFDMILHHQGENHNVTIPTKKVVPEQYQKLFSIINKNNPASIDLTKPYEYSGRYSLKNKTMYLWKSFKHAYNHEGLWGALSRTKNFIIYGKGFREYRPRTQNRTIKTHVETIVAAPNKIITNYKDKKLIVSIIIPVHNQVDFTLLCLKSIAYNPPKIPFEVIVVDDGSTDETRTVLSKRKDIVYVRNKANKGFCSSCNAGASRARGEYLFFLNNDTLVLKDWIETSLDLILGDSTIGLVGSQLTFPDGLLQEAGSIVFADGSAHNYGCGDDAYAPQYNYVRDVDYCSGAAIMVAKKLFTSIGGFDHRYSPAYYEDVDLAFSIRKAGYRVIYNPFSKVTHFRGITAGQDIEKGIKKYQVRNQQLFFRKWTQEITNYGMKDDRPIHFFADRYANKRILVLDQLTPTPDRDAGSLYLVNSLKILRDMQFKVTLTAVADPSYKERYTALIQKAGIESINIPYISSVENFLNLRGWEYDYVMVVRLPTADLYIDSVKTYCPQAKIIFFTQDLHFLRGMRHAEKEESNLLRDRAEKLKIAEIIAMRKSNCTVVVSPIEKEIIQNEYPDIAVDVIPLVLNIKDYKKREVTPPNHDISFIGGFDHVPNIDGVLWFCKKILPMVLEVIPTARFHIIGNNPTVEIRKLASDQIIVHGYVEDADTLLKKGRITVAPLRFGAGQKGKIVQSLALGVPCVATGLAMEGMGLSAGENILVANTEEEFAQMVVTTLRENALCDTLSRNGAQVIDQEFGMDIARKRFEKLFSNI